MEFNREGRARTVRKGLAVLGLLTATTLVLGRSRDGGHVPVTPNRPERTSYATRTSLMYLQGDLDLKVQCRPAERDTTPARPPYIELQIIQPDLNHKTDRTIATYITDPSSNRWLVGRNSGGESYSRISGGLPNRNKGYDLWFESEKKYIVEIVEDSRMSEIPVRRFGLGTFEANCPNVPADPVKYLQDRRLVQ